MKKVKSLIIATMFLISLLVVINPVSAVDWHVYSGQSIQTAINNASSGDTIYVHAGTYNENLLININLSLIGDGASVTTINDNSGGTSDVIHVNVGVMVDIKGFTIMNGNNGIHYDNGASGTISNNTMTGNGRNGIDVFHCSPTITNNTITGNSGSGIRNHTSCSPTITNNTITWNSWDGIENWSSSNPTITNNTITGNRDGIFNHTNSSPMVIHNTITGNTQHGIYNNSSSPAILNNTITGNSWSGIENRPNSNPTITNNVITGNLQDGISNWTLSNPTIVNNTISGNQWMGIDNRTATSIITNNIVSSNVQDGIYDNAGSTLTYNDVWGNGWSDYGGGATPGVGSISADPRLDGTFHLSSSSPCIDAGTNAGVYTDMDGEKRPMGNGFDIGADEYYVSQAFANAVAAFIPLKNYHLRQVNTCLGCIEENLPEDVPGDVQALLDEMQEHINNANTTGNTIYANNELLKALKCCEDIQEKLGITCAL